MAKIIDIGEYKTAGAEEQDGTLRLLQKYQILVTRENYLNLAFAGMSPKKLDPEVEEQLPPELKDAEK